MKARLSVVAALVLMTAPALAQEPLSQDNRQPAESSQPAAPSAPAAAQPPTLDEIAKTAGSLRKSDDDGKMVEHLGATIDQVEEMDIYDTNGKKIAEVDSVLEDASGDIKGVVIEYGGFLGIGDKGAILTFDHMKQKDGNIVVDMTEDQLPSLPAWDR